ncbi:hypothetical protein [Thomasclavelia sp.]|uniref:hypothetical protein n=1 Tax=Thomasclavelia sp. TaxID=3025757 RepID=UPI0025DE0F5D|nr:hypothetical protein [Thomasclavelia sp.]
MIIKLKEDAETIEGKKLSIDQQYWLILDGKFISVIEDKNHKQYYVNNKYIEKE